MVEAFMSSSPDELSTYAPRLLREEAPEPKRLPPAPQLVLPPLDTPAWRRPSPFDDHPGQWLAPLDVHATNESDPLSDMPPADVGELTGRSIAPKVATFAMTALGLVLLSNMSTEALQNPEASQVSTAVRTAPASEPEDAPASFASRFGDFPVVPVRQASAQATEAASAAATALPTPHTMTVAALDASSAPSAAPAPRLEPTPTLAQPLPSQPTKAVAQAAPPVQRAAAPVLAPDEIDHLINRAKGFLAQGDVGSARILLTRAAEARDPRAALALAATYDAAALRSAGVVGIKADPEQAQAWYERAAEFGSGEATHRLAALATPVR
jgi:hypothetical protein